MQKASFLMTRHIMMVVNFIIVMYDFSLCFVCCVRVVNMRETVSSVEPEDHMER